LHQRLVREHVRWQLVRRQIKDLDNLRDRRLRRDETPQIELVRRLMELRAIGTNSAWLFVREFFAWRQIRNRRELAALAGLTPTPYQSGDVAHEQGISKAGNHRMRTMLVEIAWCWLRFQPQSELAQWYQRRFGPGNSRQKKIGIVALARKLLVALWKYLDRGEVPAGAELTTWEQKVNARLRTAGPPAEGVAASCRESLTRVAKSTGEKRQQTTCLHASAAPFDLAPESALGSHFCGALSSRRRGGRYQERTLPSSRKSSLASRIPREAKGLTSGHFYFNQHEDISIAFRHARRCELDSPAGTV